MNYIDLFAGAGGLSEGFKKVGFNPIAHVEADKAACYTLKTRLAYHYLNENNQIDIYNQYLKGDITRTKLYSFIPETLLNSVINESIGAETNSLIFKKIDCINQNLKIDLIVGGPPCQAYSTMGRGALKHKKKDVRKQLYIEYGKFLLKYKPNMFVFENVPGLKTSDNGRHYKTIKEYFKLIGYRIDELLLNSWDFGVIQDRKRLILIGRKDSLEFFPIEFNNLDHKWDRDDIFSDLLPLQAGEGNRWCSYKTSTNEYLKSTSIRDTTDFTTLHISRPHNDRDLNIYKLAIAKLQNGIRLKNSDIPLEERTQNNIDDFLDRFKVVGKKPHTMIAHIAKDGHHFIHPNMEQLRSISVREAARIQSFPDNFYFEGIKEHQNRSAAFRQIGNAVPPLMAEIIANKIKEVLDGD